MSEDLRKETRFHVHWNNSCNIVKFVENRVRSENRMQDKYIPVCLCAFLIWHEVKCFHGSDVTFHC